MHFLIFPNGSQSEIATSLCESCGRCGFLVEERGKGGKKLTHLSNGRPYPPRCPLPASQSSAIIVPSVAASISAACELNRFARGNRASNRLPAIPTKTKGDPNSRMQTQPSSESD